MVSEKQLASLPRQVRMYVFALMREAAWRQISDLLKESPERQLAIATVVAANNDKHGRYFGEVSVAARQ